MSTRMDSEHSGHGFPTGRVLLVALALAVAVVIVLVVVYSGGGGY